MSETSSSSSSSDMSLDDDKVPGPSIAGENDDEATSSSCSSEDSRTSSPETARSADATAGSSSTVGVRSIPEATTDEERAMDQAFADRRRSILIVRQAFFDGSPFAKCRTRRWFEVITRSEEMVPDLFDASELDAFGGPERHAIYALHQHAASRDPEGAWAAVEARMHYILMDEWIRERLAEARPHGMYRAMQDLFPVPRRLWPTTPPPLPKGETYPRLYRFMLGPEHAHIDARSSPPLDYDRPPIEDLMRAYPNVVLRTRQRLRGADDYRLGPRL